MIEIQIVYPCTIYLIYYLCSGNTILFFLFIALYQITVIQVHIYRKTLKQISKKDKPKTGQKERKKIKKGRYKGGLETRNLRLQPPPQALRGERGSFGYTRLCFTTTPQRLITSLRRKLFNLMRYSWDFRQQITELLTVKKQCQRISWQRMNKITCALQRRYTSSAKQEAKHVFLCRFLLLF